MTEQLSIANAYNRHDHTYNVHMYLIDVYVCVPYELKLRKFREDKCVGYIEQGRKH